MGDIIADEAIDVPGCSMGGDWVLLFEVRVICGPFMFRTDVLSLDLRGTVLTFVLRIDCASFSGAT